ncbi:MAG TPA: ATP-binding protein [Nocardioides sp.]|nr:ATP-binding protein [Nocardioides sp.]
MNRLRRRVSRIPLRRRLVAGFVATMLVLLTGAAAFVYWRVQHSLDRNLDTSLRRAGVAISPHVSSSGSLPANDVDLATIDGFQVLDAGGDVLSHDGRLGATTTLSEGDVEQATRRPLFRNTGRLFIDPDDEALRLYARPLHPSGSDPRSPAVLVVALDKEQHDEALRELVGQLTVSGLAVLVLTALVGDRLARAALRPVETYRGQASDIAAGATTLRLDVPAERDDEITRLGDTLNDMLDALTRALDRERRFTNDASHELRTPLTRLTSRVQLTLRRPRTVAEHERALEEIRQDLTRLTTLADELLTLGAEGQGAPGSTDLPTDLSALLGKVTSLRTTLAPAGSPYAAVGAVSLTTSGRCLVDLDAVRLERTVDNILDNAEVHGATPVGISLDTAAPGPAGPWVRLVVRDSGPGMPADLLATATERFARAPEARSRPGSGLGLALVAKLVETAGGELRLCHAGLHQSTGRRVPVDCEHDEAMTVTVLLPGARDRPDGAGT